jgi:hypothetical protein
MRLGCEGIAKEKYGFDQTFRDAASNDQVAPVRPMRDPLDIKAEFVVEKLAGIAGCDQWPRAEKADAGADESQHVVLHPVVCNQRKHDELRTPPGDG